MSPAVRFLVFWLLPLVVYAAGAFAIWRRTRHVEMALLWPVVLMPFLLVGAVVWMVLR